MTTPSTLTQKQAPDKSAGFFQWLFFTWVSSLVYLGNKRQLDADDLWSLDPSEDAKFLRTEFWEDHQRRVEGPEQRPSRWKLFRSVVGVARVELIVSGLYMALYSASQLANPVLLRQLVNSMAEPGYDGLYYSIGLLVSSLLGAIGSQLHFHYAFNAGRKCRVLYMSLVYEHLLHLSSSKMSSLSSGEIINMMSADANKFFEISQFIHLFWAGPVQIIVVIVFLLIVIGIPALAGIGMLFLIAPINYLSAKLKRSLRAKHMPAMDKRVRLCTEILSGIRIVKLFGWELPFLKRIREFRDTQMKFVNQELYLFAFNISILIMTPPLATMATFVTHAATGNVLNAADTFSALAFFNVLRFPLMQISQALMMGAQVHVAIDRLFEYLAVPVSDSLFDGTGNARAGKMSEKLLSIKALNSGDHDDDDDSDATGEPAMPQDVTVNAGQVGSPDGSDPASPNVSTTTSPNASTTASPNASATAFPNAGVTTTESPDDMMVSIQDAAFNWVEDPITKPDPVHKEDPTFEFQLENVSLNITRGQLVACVGPVGAGKSSLVHAMLGELHLVRGSFANNAKSIAYCSQTPWILNASVQDNITFGLPFDETKFRETLDLCCLWADLEQLNEREKTMIGERGVTLSGGQKARISLARAVYSDPDLLLLDDPLSALDAHVGRKIFNNLLSPTTGKFRNKTRFLVTHAVQYLSQCDNVLLMYQGKVAFQGAFDQLRSIQEGKSPPTGSASAVGEFKGDGPTQGTVHDAGSLASVVEMILESSQNESRQDEDVPADATEDVPADTANDKDLAHTTYHREASTEYDVNMKTLHEADYKSTNVMTKEERTVGAISRGTIHQYILASGGYVWMMFVLFLLLMERVTYIASDWWLSTWTSAETGPPDTPFDLPAGNTTEGINYYMFGYVGCTLINSVFVMARTIAFVIGGGRAARVLFEKLTWRVVRAPVAFFESTPLGRITNRFSFDTEVIDDILVQSLNGMVASFFWLSTAVIVMITVTPLSAVIIVPVLVFFFLVHRLYRRSCVEIQRLDSVSRSPIQSSFRETLDGLTTIRAYYAEDRFLAINNKLVDNNNAAVFAFVSSNRWLGIRLDTMGALCTFAVATASWLARDTITPGLVGLATLWAFNLTTSFNFFVTLSTLSEAKMTSVERVVSYGNDIPQEPSLETMGSKPHKDWPSKGGIVMDNVSLKYREDLPPAMNNLNAHIKPKEHIGIVGRTGAGKSTITVSMFRLRELSNGTISVDGIDLSTLGLADVRGRAMYIIPQEATVFSGTVRFNLDPFDEFDDQKIKEALKRAQILDFVEQLGGVDATVEENGSNFSQGQRQLLCLARAILRKPKILIMDEATASVDPETDHFIQKTIRNEFKDTTVVEIAHRLHSIMDCHRVMVLERGSMVEFDSPRNLLNKKGTFYSLVQSTGPAMAKQLEEMAFGAEE